MVLVDMSTDTQEYGYQQTADKHQDSVDTDMDDYDMLMFTVGAIVLGALLTIFMMIFCAIAYQKKRTNELAKRLILPKYNYSYSISPRFESINVYTSTDKPSSPENQRSYDKELVSLSSSEHEWVNRCHQYRASASSLTLLEDTSAAPPGSRSNLHQQYRSAVRAFQSSNSSTDQSNTSTSSSQQTNNDAQDIIQSPSPNSWVAEYLRRASTGTLDDDDCRPLMRHPLRRQSSVYTIEDDNSAGSHPPPHPRASQIQHLDSFIY